MLFTNGSEIAKLWHRKHYLQTTDAHFQAATIAEHVREDESARKTAQSAAASLCVDSQDIEDSSGMTYCVAEKWAALDSNQ